jgi:cytochrome b6-f complex iron-sulfur subunit
MPGRLEPEPLPRRDFLGLAGLWAAAIAVLGSLLGMMRLPSPRVLPEVARRFRIGRPEDYPSGSETLIPGQNVVVVASDDGVAAISLVCTHLGCIVKRDGADFACPCHGSVFGELGGIVAGPAPRGLRWLRVSQTVDGRLAVDSGREVEPGTYFRA